ncbi:MAG: hypothetical protein K0R41_2442 [Geminicoccaceae bacterium]|jgi:hypothetical protein|nr:hypothetical protein [Geminicoccaceae bacterium]
MVEGTLPPLLGGVAALADASIAGDRIELDRNRSAAVSTGELLDSSIRPATGASNRLAVPKTARLMAERGIAPEAIAWRPVAAPGLRTS